MFHLRKEAVMGGGGGGGSGGKMYRGQEEEIR